MSVSVAIVDHTKTNHKCYYNVKFSNTWRSDIKL